MFVNTLIVTGLFFAHVILIGTVVYAYHRVRASEKQALSAAPLPQKAG